MTTMRYTLRQIKDGTGFDPDTQFETVEDYNGWTNRETWAVALYINNDQGWQEQIHEDVRQYVEGKRDIEEEPQPYMAGDIIRQSVERLLDPSQYRDEYGEQQPEALAIISYDIGSLYRVDWTELGASFLSDVAEASDN